VYTEDQVKNAYEYFYGNDQNCEYEYGCDGTVWIHSQGGCTYLKLTKKDMEIAGRSVVIYI